MIKNIKQDIYNLLRWSEKYTKTDMIYFVTGNFWLTIGRFIAIGSGILLTLAFANLISPEIFGTYKYILAIAGFVGAFSLSGLGGAVTLAVAQERTYVVPHASRIAFLWSLPGSFLALCGSLYYFFMHNATLGFGLLFIALTNSFFNVFVFSKSIALGKKDFKGMTLIGMLTTILPIALLITTLFITTNIIIILFVYFLSNFVSGLFSYKWFMKKYVTPKGDIGIKETITYGKHLSVMGATSQMVSNLDQLLLWHFSGPVSLAMYSFALAPVREIRNFAENIHPLIFPKFANKTVAEMKQTVPLRIFQLLVVSLIIGIMYIISAPWLYTILLPQYVSAIFASQLLAVALIFQPKGIIETMLHAQGNTRLRYVAVFTTQGIKVVLSVILIPIYGFMGAVVSVVFTDAFSALILWMIYKKLT